MRNYFANKLKGLKAGDKVYILAEHSRVEPYEATVLSIGRIYITVGEGKYVRRKFYKESGCEQDWPYATLFSSKEESEECLAIEEKERFIRLNAGKYALSPEEIDIIYNILKKHQKE